MKYLTLYDLIKYYTRDYKFVWYPLIPEETIKQIKLNVISKKVYRD